MVMKNYRELTLLSSYSETDLEEEVLEDEVADDETLDTSDDNENSILPFLLKIRQRVVTACINEKHPAFICEADGWIRRPLVPNIVRKSKNLDPLELVYPDVFVNAPDVYTALKCRCGHELSFKGWADVFRRVVCLNRTWYLLSRRYRCDNRWNKEGCGKTFIGHTQFILGQLPESVRLSFPAILTKRMALSKLLFDQLRPMVNLRMGPFPTVKMLRELHTKEHDLRHLAYLEEVKKRISQPTAICPQRSFLPFPDFAESYGGRLPSPGFVCAVYNLAQRTYQDRRNQHMSMISADILSSDFSHKLPKRVARVEGCPVYTAVHTFGNEFGEIRAHTLTATKSLAELDQPIRGMLHSLKQFGHEAPKLLFVDDVPGTYACNFDGWAYRD